MRKNRLLSELTGALLLLAEPRKRCLPQRPERQGPPSETPAAAPAPPPKIEQLYCQSK
jgi:hypothetical protein